MSWNGLGVITVSSAGTKVPLSTTKISCAAIIIQALANATHTNTGKIYLFDRSNNRIATLPAPSSSSIASAGATVPMSPGSMNVADYSIDAEISGDGVDASYVKP